VHKVMLELKAMLVRQDHQDHQDQVVFQV